VQFTEIEGGVTAPAGFLAGGLHCGIKKDGQPDLAIIFSERSAAVAGVFTRNLVKAAPVLYNQHVLKHGSARAIVVNSGNANAVTGKQGKVDAEAMARTAERCLGLAPLEAAVASTGVIGQTLPIDKIMKGIEKLAPMVSRDGGEQAARAIMTTDTFPKKVAIRVPLSRGEIVIGGMAKGAGMICPDLATMLVFITTDANVERECLHHTLRAAVEPSFNSITVDGDSSTNDTVLVLANGASNTAVIDDLSVDCPTFRAALHYVCMRLAEMIVRDGEGATKLARVTVTGAQNAAAARQIAKTIANSLLVKTAIFGNDANWGRIICAAGRAGVEFDPGKVDILLGDLIVLKEGSPWRFDETRAKELLSRNEVEITLILNAGGETATVLTCDLSYDYVKINASYRT
jgi:glutamate N-acetyltransferase/amino-acid N-acetyltransferase